MLLLTDYVVQWYHEHTNLQCHVVYVKSLILYAIVIQEEYHILTLVCIFTVKFFKFIFMLTRIFPSYLELNSKLALFLFTKILVYYNSLNCVQLDIHKKSFILYLHCDEVYICKLLWYCFVVIAWFCNIVSTSSIPLLYMAQQTYNNWN